MLIKWGLGLFGASTFVKIAKDYGAKRNIERKGLYVIDDPRSFTEQVFSFVNDYFYLFIPIYNIYKTLQLIRMNGNEYAAYRQSVLEDRERILTKEEWDLKHGIKPVKKEEPKKEEKKEEKPLEPVKQNTQNKPVQAQGNVTPFRQNLDNTPYFNQGGVTQNVPNKQNAVISDAEYLENNKLDRKLRDRLKALELGGATVAERNVVTLKLYELDREYKADKKMELDYLKSKRESLNNELNNSMKLVRK